MMDPTNGTHPAGIRAVEHRHSVIARSARVSSHAQVGAPGEWRDRPSVYPARVGEGATIREFARVHMGCQRETVIGARALLMAGSHVGHDAHVGEDCELAPNVVVGGHCTIGARVRIGMNASILPGVTVGDGARIGAGSVVMRDVPANETWVGVPARKVSKWNGVSGPEVVRELDAYHHGEAS